MHYYELLCTVNNFSHIINSYEFILLLPAHHENLITLLLLLAALISNLYAVIEAIEVCGVINNPIIILCW